MKRRLLQLVIAVATLLSGRCWADPGAPDAVLRCGWFDNPTPGNAWLIDRDGEWTIGIQGGHQSEGPWPTFKPSQWVRTGSGNHGHGCACLKLQVDGDSFDVQRIVSSQPRPLAACRKDAALKGKEPVNPLK